MKGVVKKPRRAAMGRKKIQISRISDERNRQVKKTKPIYCLATPT